MDTFQLHLLSIVSTSKNDADPIRAAITGVLRNAQEGELPLFAWALGMTQPAFIAMLRECFPEIEELEMLPDHQYQGLMATIPEDFLMVKNLLLDLCSTKKNAKHVDWLASAVAAACQGSRHLWQDLGLSNRDEVSALLQEYFEPLYILNIQNLKWKRFIYTQLGMRLGKPDLQPPKCRQCDQFNLCFPLSVTNDSPTD